MKLKASLALAFGLIAGMAHSATELVIATVNNGHMIEMQKLSKHLKLPIPASHSNGSRWKKACCASASPPTSPPRAVSSTS
jgi:hypothetical protein